MTDQPITQAEIDALIQSHLEQKTAPAGAAAGPDPLLLLREPVSEFAHHGVAALSDLFGSLCEGALADLSASTVQEVPTLGSAQVLIGQTLLDGPVSGAAYYVVPFSLAQRMAGSLPAEVRTGEDPLADAFGRLFGRLNEGGWTHLASGLDQPVSAAAPQVVAAASLAAAGLEQPETPVWVAGIDLAAGEAVGRLLLVVPQATLRPLLSALGASQPAVSAKPQPAAPAPAMATGAAVSLPTPAVFAQADSYLSPATLPVETAASPVSDPPPRNLNLLMDVVVRITVELGRTRRHLRDVLNLGPGAVIELDRLASEPVDVMVNGKPIATAEVVVVDENYGVRVTEVLSPAERIHAFGRDRK